MVKGAVINSMPWFQNTSILWGIVQHIRITHLAHYKTASHACRMLSLIRGLSSTFNTSFCMQLDQQLQGSEVSKDHWISWPWSYFLWFKVNFLVWCENVWGVLSVNQMLCKPLGSGAYCRSIWNVWWFSSNITCCDFSGKKIPVWSSDHQEIVWYQGSLLIFVAFSSGSS